MRDNAKFIDITLRKPPKRSAVAGEEGEEYLQRLKPVRMVSVPEPVDVSRAIGRPPQVWEMWLIIRARREARARELELLRGLL